jgi:hypothetical protein
MKKIVLTFGLISGAIIAAELVILLPFEETAGEAGIWLGYATIVAAMILIHFGIRQYRETVGNGRVGFGRAFSIGILIALICSLCYTATWEVIYFGGKSDFAEKYAARTVEQMKAKGKPQAEIDARAREMQEWAVKYHNPLYNSAQTMLEPFPVGILIALISAGVLSRRRKDGVTTSRAVAAGA